MKEAAGLVTFAHTEKIPGMEWDHTGYRLASGSNDNSVKIWDIRTSLKSDGVDRKVEASCSITLKHAACVKALSWSPKNRNQIVTGGGFLDCSLKIWDLNSGAVVARTNATTQVTGLHWSAKLESILSFHRDGSNVRIWGSRMLKHFDHMSIQPSDNILSAVVNTAESRIAAADTGERLHIFDLSNGESQNRILSENPPKSSIFKDMTIR